MTGMNGRPILVAGATGRQGGPWFAISLNGN